MSVNHAFVASFTVNEDMEGCISYEALCMYVVIFDCAGTENALF